MQRLSQIASSEGVKLHGADVAVAGITADSREVKPGYLFVAIPGAKHDGAQFIDEAVKRGAAAVLVSDKVPLPLAGCGKAAVKSALEVACATWVRGGRGVSFPWQTAILASQKSIPDSETDHLAPPPRPPLTQVAQATSKADLTAALPQPASGRGITVLTAPDIRRAVSSIAAAFYARQPDTVAAVTGTSGKTSTAQIAREIWQAMGEASASIGTLGLVTASEERYGSLTTPDAITLHRLLDECAGKGITHLAMEASSHGLALHRLDHVRLKAGGFTNLSRDHLDYHATMEDYLAAKLRLFRELLPAGAAAVLNADIAEFGLMAETAEKRGLKVISYGKKARDIRLLDAVPDAKGQKLRIEIFGAAHEVDLPLIGAFQAWNALCALGLVTGSGGDAAKAAAALGKVTGVPGRLQLAGISPKGGAVFVDYAHKPDALDNVLQALRPHAAAHKNARLGVVFGCGGNRDKGKRPIMGAIASRLADWVIVTDDNPRHEEPAAIRREILAGCQGADVAEIGDRAQAIEAGIARLGPGDVLVIAGKGHEHGQIVGDETRPFDDRETARHFLS